MYAIFSVTFRYFVKPSLTMELSDPLIDEFPDLREIFLSGSGCTSKGWRYGSSLRS
jgi:hypothetical protein